MSRSAPPAEEQDNPYLPKGPAPLLCEQFAGINTQATRVGVDDKQLYWLDGFFPIAPYNARTMPGVGTPLYTSPGGTTVAFFDFYNLGITPYMVVILSNGAIDQVNTSTLAVTHIATAGTIQSPLRTSVGISQWGSQYLLIVSTQVNGYFLWDGANLFTAGTLGPLITLTNPGSGYQTTPSVTASGGHGSGAIFVATIANGQVTGIILLNPGSGYIGGDTVSLVFSGGNAGGTG